MRPVEVLDSAVELPVAGAPPAERADARRNRRKILAVAERLCAARGAENVSMDEIAEAAGVGKGTLYRRFGDRRGLAYAILDERERELQEAIIRGEPPLGPGAPPAERLIAYGEAALAHLERHGDLMLAAQSGGPMARFRGPVYPFHRSHVRRLVRELDPSLDADVIADVLLGALGAEIVNYWRGLGVGDRRITAGFADLVTRIAAGRERR